MIIATNGGEFGKYSSLPIGFTECADRPANYVHADIWSSDPTAQTFDPMDPDVCWRVKNQTELDTEKESEADLMRNLKKVIIAKATIDYSAIAELRTAYDELPKYLKAIRDKYRDSL